MHSNMIIRMRRYIPTGIYIFHRNPLNRRRHDGEAISMCSQCACASPCVNHQWFCNFGTSSARCPVHALVHLRRSSTRHASVSPILAAAPFRCHAGSANSIPSTHLRPGRQARVGCSTNRQPPPHLLTSVGAFWARAKKWTCAATNRFGDQKSRDSSTQRRSILRFSFGLSLKIRLPISVFYAKPYPELSLE
jgi:hypothetical protein